MKGENLKIKLVFLDWRKKGNSIYCTEEGWHLQRRDFHGGTTFDGTIKLDKEQAIEFKKAIEVGYQPCFWVINE